MGTGWVTPGGGGGSVDDILFALPIELAGTTAPGTTLGAHLIWQATHVGTASVVYSEPTLEIAAPLVGDVYTLNTPVIGTVPLGGAPVFLPPTRSIQIDNPGSVLALGSVKFAIFGEFAGPLVDGEPTIEGLTLFNTSMDPAAKDLRAESPMGRFVVLSDITSLGQGGVKVEDILGVFASRGLTLAPSAPGAQGVSIDGVNTTVFLVNAVGAAPPGGGYTTITLEPTATINSQLVVTASTLVGQSPTDYLLHLSASATVPGGPLPTSEVGIRVENTTSIVGELYDPAGLDAVSEAVSSTNHLNGPRSNWIGSASYNSAGAPPDAGLDHAGFANVPLIVPYTNGAIAPDLRELEPTAAMERHLLVTGTPDAVSINAGGSYIGADGNYPATQSASSGIGTGAEFTVTLTAGAITAVVAVEDNGLGDYEIGDTITLNVIGPTETVAAVLDVDRVAWLLRNQGASGFLTGDVSWRVDFEKTGANGSTVVGYLARRAGGTGPWVEVPDTRSIPKDLLNTPQTADGTAPTKNQGVGDEYTVFWINDNVGATSTLFTIIIITIGVQP